MDTSAKRRRRWAVEIKRRIAEESFAGSASVAQLAQKYAVNANQIFLWRKQYREGRLDNNTSTKLLPVTVPKEVVVSAANQRNPSCQASTGSLKIELAKGNLRIAGSVDLAVLRAALECLLR
ncbi:MAG: transposase [Candidatus Acidiferrales bacterium]